MSRFFRLSKSEWLLLVEAVTLVAIIRIGLWIFPYDRIRRYLQTLHPRPQKQPSPARIAQFVSAASRLIPKTNCLTRALAADALLRWHGHDACLRIGVSKNSPNGILAHAWVESGGEVVIGADAMEGLTLLRPVGT